MVPRHNHSHYAVCIVVPVLRLRRFTMASRRGLLGCSCLVVLRAYSCLVACCCLCWRPPTDTLCVRPTFVRRYRPSVFGSSWMEHIWCQFSLWYIRCVTRFASGSCLLPSPLVCFALLQLRDDACTCRENCSFTSFTVTALLPPPTLRTCTLFLPCILVLAGATTAPYVLHSSVILPADGADVHSQPLPAAYVVPSRHSGPETTRGPTHLRTVPRGGLPFFLYRFNAFPSLPALR